MDKYLLHTFIEKHSVENGDRIAISHGELEVNYHGLNESVNQVARLLLSKNVEKGDRIGILMSSSIEYLVCLFAIMKIGGIAVPLEANYPVNKLKSIVKEIEPKLIFAAKENREILKTVLEDKYGNVLLVSYNQDGLSLYSSDEKKLEGDFTTGSLVTDVNGEDSCYLLFTSGSTNKPKGIEGVFKSLSHFIHWEVSMLELDHTAKVSQLAPVSFDVSLRDIFVPILVGGTICIPPDQIKFQIREFLKWLQSSEVKVIHCVPSYFRLLIKALQDDDTLIPCVSTVQKILVAGEPLYGRDINNWFNLVGDRVQLVNLYGPSETTLAKIFYKIPFDKYQPDMIMPLGKPISNTSVLITADGQMCNEGQKAEILIKTPFRTKGYYNNDELNKEKFIQNPLHNEFEDIVFCTGDIGSFDHDGNVLFHGRKDSMVKYNGNRIELTEIQNVALKMDDIDLAIAQLNSTEGDDQVLMLYYKSKTDSDHTTSLKQLYNANLPLYMHPALFIAMDEVPRLPNGKVDKHNLSSIPIPSQSEGEEIVDELELEIAEIWKKLLGVTSITSEQSFFQLGGTSLKAIQMISQIYKAKKVLLSLKNIFNQPTVSGIKELIEEASGASNETKEKSQEIIKEVDEFSFTQNQLFSWIINEQDSADFNMPYIYTISGNLDAQVLGDAINKVTGSYEFFKGKSGQKLQDYFSNASDIENLSNSNSNEVKNYVANLITAPLAKDALPIQFKIIALGQDVHLFVLLTNLTKMDGASVGIIFDEIQKSYLSIQKGEDYQVNSSISTNKEILKAESISNEEHTKFWKDIYQKAEQIKGSNGVHTFDSSKLKYQNFAFRDDEIEKLNEFARDNDTSVQIVVTSIFEQVLGELIDKESIVYNSVISSRHRYEKSILGNALYFIPFIADRKNTTKEQLKSVENKLFSTLEHIPFQVETNNIRPEIVLNIVDEVNNSSQTHGDQHTLEIGGYPHYQATGRFPISVTITIRPYEIAFDTSILENLDHINNNIEMTVKHVFNEFLQTALKYDNTNS